MRKQSRNNYWAIIAFTLVAMIPVLPGCGKKESPPPPSAKPAAKPEMPKPVPVQKQMSSAGNVAGAPMSTEFVSQKDPFKPLVADTKSGVPFLKRNRLGQVLPILNYDLAQFRVTGIIVGLKENRAQVIDPTGKPYVVKVGMEMGRNEGRVTKITPTYVEVFEKYRDESGKLVKNYVRLELRKKQ